MCTTDGDLPLHDALVGTDDGGLDVDGVVPHPPQLHGLLQSSHHEQGVVSLCLGQTQRKRFAVACTTQSRQRAAGTLTSVGVSKLGAAEEAQVARPGPDRLGVPETEPGVEVVGLEDLLAVTAVVAAAVVSAVHPDLQEQANQQRRKKTRTSAEEQSTKEIQRNEFIHRYILRAHLG